MLSLLAFLIVGLIAGFIARAVVPGDDSMGIIGTLILGIGGSFIGGLLGNLLTGDGIEFNAAGVIGSVVGAIILLVIVNAVTGRKKRT